MTNELYYGDNLDVLRRKIATLPAANATLIGRLPDAVWKKVQSNVSGALAAKSVSST